MRAVVMVTGYGRPGIEVDFGNAHSIFYKENLDAATGKSLLARFLRPTRWHQTQFLILQQLNRYIAKRLV
jgi:hypothetical protein